MTQCLVQCWTLFVWKLSTLLSIKSQSRFLYHRFQDACQETIPNFNPIKHITFPVTFVVVVVLKYHRWLGIIITVLLAEYQHNPTIEIYAFVQLGNQINLESHIFFSILGLIWDSPVGNLISLKSPGSSWRLSEGNQQKDSDRYHMWLYILSKVNWPLHTNHRHLLF